IGILGAPQLDVGHGAGRQQQHHQKADQRLVTQCPGREIEAADAAAGGLLRRGGVGHEFAPAATSASSRTAWPGTSLCTPAVTTFSPGFSPAAISTACST